LSYLFATGLMGLTLAQKSSDRRGRRRRQAEIGRTGARFGPSGAWRADQPDVDEVEPLFDEPDPESSIGLTGARFSGPVRRKPAEPEPAAESQPDQVRKSVPQQRPESRTASAARPRPNLIPSPSPRPRPKPRVDPAWDIAPEPVAKPLRPETWHDLREQDHDDWTHRPESHALVRPYAWTGGRTKGIRHLAIEALVLATGVRPSWEHRPIADLCATARSVAEISALLSLPLGVARVLIGDLAEQGVVVVDRKVGMAPDLAMLDRVLHGLRNL
jgi:hypothetical protein